MDSVDWLLIGALVAIAGVGALGLVAFVAGLRAGRRADLLEREHTLYLLRCANSGDCAGCGHRMPLEGPCNRCGCWWSRPMDGGGVA